MNKQAAELKKEFQKSLDLMHTLRDEVRLMLHLAEKDAKDEWRKLEPHLDEVERAANELSEATGTALTEAIKRLRKLRSSLS